MMRQGANSAVRFTTYSILKQFCQGAIRGGQELSSVVIFEIGGIAGLVTDSVTKTRMQSLKARPQCRTSFHCDYRIFTEEGG